MIWYGLSSHTRHKRHQQHLQIESRLRMYTHVLSAAVLWLRRSRPEKSTTTASVGSGSASKTASFAQQCAICTHVQLAELVSKAPKSQGEFKASTNNLTVARAPEHGGEPLMIEARHELAKSDTKHAKTWAPDREHMGKPLQGRTDEPKKNDQKPLNVSHEAALTNWLLLAAGCWLLRAGCLLLAACLLLPTACWLLAADYWLPAGCCKNVGPGQGSTMAVKDGEATKSNQKTA